MKPNNVRPVLLVFSLLAGSFAHAADQPTQRELDNLRKVMEENFAACNREDVDALIDNHHPLVPQELLGRLRGEAEQCFKETDVKVRLVGFLLTYYENPASPALMKIAQVSNSPACNAYAVVWQLTLPADHSYADLEEYPADMSSEYRHMSAMLPCCQFVQYTIQLSYDYKARKWKSYAIQGQVEAVHQWPKNLREIMRGETAPTDCKMGVCPEPLVSSRNKGGSPKQPKKRP